MTARDDLHALLDHLNDEEAALWLEAMRTRDPVLLTALLAPLDDEAETEEERAAVAAAHEDYTAGRVRGSAQVRRELLG